MESNSLFGTQVRVCWLSYWFCLTGETWGQVIYPWCNAIKKKKLVRHLKMQIYDRHVRLLLLWISEHFRHAKAAESSEYGSNQTTTHCRTPTVKRGRSDSGSSTSQSSSKQKCVRAWLKDYPWLAYSVRLWSKCCFQADVTGSAGSEEVLYSWALFCWVQWKKELYFKHDHVKCIYVV